MKRSGDMGNVDELACAALEAAPGADELVCDAHVLEAVEDFCEALRVERNKSLLVLVVMKLILFFFSVIL